MPERGERRVENFQILKRLSLKRSTMLYGMHVSSQRPQFSGRDEHRAAILLYHVKRNAVISERRRLFQIKRFELQVLKEM